MARFIYKGKDPEKRGKTVGITTQEFTVMCQIMSFKFDVPSAEAKPSLARIAGYMGCSVDTVRRAKNSMEEKGALCVEYHGHEGQPNVYDFGELARQCLAFEQETPAKLQGVAELQPPTPAKLQGLPPVNLQGKEEEEKKKKPRKKKHAQALLPDHSLSSEAKAIMNAFEKAQPGYSAEREEFYLDDAEWLAENSHPQDVTEYIAQLRKDDWWAMKVISLSYIKQHITTEYRPLNGNGKPKVSAQLQVRIQEYADEHLMTYQEAEAYLLENM